jgi:carboxyl-terminal processing protease
MHRFGRPVLAIVLLIASSSFISAQQLTSQDRGRVQGMLQRIDEDVRKHYYDANLHGVDWNTKVREANENINKAQSMGLALSQIASLLDTLNDSHTFFIPPSRPYRHDYGFRMQMIGDHCLVTRVRPKSDAESKGVKPGDEVVSVNGFTPTRDFMWKLNYVFNLLRPQPGLHLQLRSPDGKEREVDVMAKVRELPRVVDVGGAAASEDINDLIRQSEDQDEFVRARYAEMGGTLIVKVPVFYPAFSNAGTRVDPTAQFEGIISKARKHDGLILDLRGNPGGAVEILRVFLGGVMSKETTIGDRVLRNDRKTMATKFDYGNSFHGQLAVLIDSESASAAEIFSRAVQLEKRGTVLGDLSSGSVMEARVYDHDIGTDTTIFYAASISDADLIMTDGKSLEHVGVTPDKLVLPTPLDLANGRDPVMSQAAEMMGAKLSPEDAYKLFPYVWPKQ